MKFKDFKYERPDMDVFKTEFYDLLKKFKEADTFEKQDEVMASINDARNKFESMTELVYIRHTIDTTDKYYEAENDYVDEITPVYEGLVTEYYKELVGSRFRNELESKWGKHIFNVAELKMKTFKDEVLNYLMEENKLQSKYVKLLSSARIQFEGEERNLSQMRPFYESGDRDIRKNAHMATTKFFEDNESEFDRIFDELVKTRHEIATKLGFKNFVELAYARLRRSGYDSGDVAVFREQVKKEIVPYANKLRDRQAKRLGIDKLKYYDMGFTFNSGNAKPQGDPEWIIANGLKMYKEMSPETEEFFNFMVDKELLDLVAKKGKSGGGYCANMNYFKAPFIFSNFNGTSGDVDVLTHEAGHAFQKYQNRDFKIPEYTAPTYEASEIFSMSMEFLAYPWMESFFKEQVDKYKYSHLSESMLFIPYGVLVDEFQHEVYENPDMTPEERKTTWRDLEKKYLPSKDYEDNQFLQRGGFWFRQAHIYEVPFYYIDYTLAQVCAFQFWAKANENREKAWNDYMNLCRAGGSKPFLELVEVANLKNPFENGSIKEVVEKISDYLEEIDDSRM